MTTCRPGVEDAGWSGGFEAGTSSLDLIRLDSTQLNSTRLVLGLDCSTSSEHRHQHQKTLDNNHMPYSIVQMACIR